MIAVHPVSSAPKVSVIVPARNEEACLRACLESLVMQSGIRFEIILVNDGSTDHTRQIAESFPAVRVIDAGKLPDGWSGKSNALVCGAAEAGGRWLLFTDADTVHRPGSLSRSVAEAEQRAVSLLSYSPEQVVGGLWEKAVMPVIFGELASTYRPHEVSDPNSPAAAANGQYLLITREAYDQVRGFAAVATSLLEDVAMAHAVKACGRRIFFRFGGDAVRTRMYRSFGQLREGWTKNLAILFASPVRLAVLRLTEFLLMTISFGAAAFAMSRGHIRTASVCGAVFLLVVVPFLLRIRKAHFATGAWLLAPFGLPLFSYLLLRSSRCHAKGRVSWKGRQYRPGTSAPAPQPNQAGRNLLSGTRI